MTQAHIFYSGIVQGVGFRYTVHRYATYRQMTGWVRNLSDGRVEVVVNGSREDIESMMNDVASHFEGMIKDTEINYGDAKEEYSGFRITQ